MLTNVARPAWPKKQPEVDAKQQALAAWERAKELLTEAKDAEMQARKLAFELNFTDAKEGTNTVELCNGYQLKGIKKLNYALKAPDGFSGRTIDAVEEVADRFASISNEGSFIADRLFEYSVEMSISEYRTLCEDAKVSKVKAALLRELNTVLVITEVTPTLEIKAPKGKR